MTTQRRSKTMPTEGQTTKFLYAILKQLDLKTIDWSLVATELEISNGHAARMRYSRFKQQMEATTTIAPKSVKPKKTNSKTDSGKAAGAAKPSKGMHANDKNGKGSVNFSNSSKIGISTSGGNRGGNSKKRSAPEDFTKQETTNYSLMSSIERDQHMNDSGPMLYPPSAIPSFYPPLNRTGFNSDTAFPYMQMQQPLQQQIPDPFSTYVLGSEGTMFNPSFVPESYDTFDNEPPVDYNADTSGWSPMEYCFSGCCQPQYPPTPKLFQSYPLEKSENPCLGVSQPLTSEPLCQPQQPQNLWVPVKSEPGSEESSDDLLVKVETDA
ncbi:hypothetical protein UA08_00723 [Talaromyces atroroseus]|uniref:Myb-like DNA-binding domain-containing protein n=1 Tax=Talaromyces atroroseus TaxID=1441469 RepID=A0A225AX34_TALAT|nr:hypothetical protein UA08_00723 [Talaromyces atroroseus]OKL64173.1 hypothetical protein UA08_00723 [Talaromyces atroroseus]